MGTPLAHNLAAARWRAPTLSAFRYKSISRRDGLWDTILKLLGTLSREAGNSDQGLYFAAHRYYILFGWANWGKRSFKIPARNGFQSNSSRTNRGTRVRNTPQCGGGIPNDTFSNPTVSCFQSLKNSIRGRPAHIHQWLIEDSLRQLVQSIRSGAHVVGILTLKQSSHVAYMYDPICHMFLLRSGRIKSANFLIFLFSSELTLKSGSTKTGGKTTTHWWCHKFRCQDPPAGMVPCASLTTEAGR
jgi:hypothetical protein